MPAIISGATRVYGIIADPISHVRTPQALNALMQMRGFDGVMVPMHVAPDALAGHLAALRGWHNFGGFIATVPHKSAMVDLCDVVSERARAIGAANAVRREPDGSLVADMLDGDGFVAGLCLSGFEPARLSAYLAGAGGAGNAIAFALADAGIAGLTIHNRTRRRAEDLVDRLARAYPGLAVAIGTEDPAGHDLVVNATSLGLRPYDPLPLDGSRLDASMIVAEIIMHPEITRLLAVAQSQGCQIQPGLPMLMGQVEAMAHFLGMAS